MTSTRKRMRARASRARSVGHTCGAGVLSFMWRALQPLGSGGLDVSELFSQPSRWRAASDQAEFPVKVRLVEVAALGRQVGQTEWLARLRAVPECAPGPVEPDDASGSLRRQAGLRAEPVPQVPVTPSGFCGQRADGGRAARPDELTPDVADLGTNPDGPASLQAREQGLVEDREALVPAGCAPEPVLDLAGQRAEDVVSG